MDNNIEKLKFKLVFPVWLVVEFWLANRWKFNKIHLKPTFSQDCVWIYITCSY